MAKALPPPPFDIPLTDDQLILMGKIAVMWGQIDEGFNQALRWVLNVPPTVFESLLGNQMMGSRLAHLRAASATVTKPDNQKRILNLTDKLTAVLPARNAAMHGCWGRFVLDPSFGKFRIGTYNHQKPKARFYATNLAALYTELTAILALIGELLMHSVEDSPDPIKYDRHRIYFAPRIPSGTVVVAEFRRGDKVVRVESKSRNWREQ